MSRVGKKQHSTKTHNRHNRGVIAIGARIKMIYCDQCIQYGPDLDNSVKHDPVDCPINGAQNRHAEGFHLTESQVRKIKSITHPTRSTGIIRKFFPERGYGFIKPDCGGYDVWIHRKFCVEGYYPQEGDRVVYLTRLGERGNFVAKEVDSISGKFGIDPGHESGDRTIFNQPIIQETLSIVNSPEPIANKMTNTLRQVNQQFESIMAGTNDGSGASFYNALYGSLKRS